VFNFTEALKLLSKLTPTRFFNLVKVFLSYWISVISQKPIMLGLPISIAIEPTNYCNLFCKECPSGSGELNRKRGFLDDENFNKIISNIPKQTMFLNFNFQGEPFLNLNTINFIKASVKRNVYTSISTNAHFPNKEVCENIVKSGLHKIIVSLDGANNQIYQTYRSGGDFETVINNIQKLIMVRRELNSKTPQIVLQFLVLKSNEHQINEINLLGKKLGVDKIELKSAQVIHFEDIENTIPTISKFSRYKKSKSGTYLLKRKIRNRCYKMWSSTVICWDGNIVPCCFDKDAQFKMGNIFENEFEELWNSKNYNHFRKKILKDRKSFDICCNCNE
jgi:radical SAM protein with 4Fe4S-binding SPASM domain